MTLIEAAKLYVSRRRSQGSPFISTDVNLHAFCRSCGDLQLNDLTSEHVIRFCNKSECAAATRLSKFSAVNALLSTSPHAA